MRRAETGFQPAPFEGTVAHRHRRFFTLGFRDLQPPDPSDRLSAPVPRANLETPPSFLRIEKLRQRFGLLVPMHQGKTSDRAPLFADRLPCPRKACNRSSPDAVAPGPASR